MVVETEEQDSGGPTPVTEVRLGQPTLTKTALVFFPNNGMKHSSMALFFICVPTINVSRYMFVTKPPLFRVAPPEGVETYNQIMYEIVYWMTLKFDKFLTLICLVHNGHLGHRGSGLKLLFESVINFGVFS